MFFNRGEDAPISFTYTTSDAVQVSPNSRYRHAFHEIGKLQAAAGLGNELDDVLLSDETTGGGGS